MKQLRAYGGAPLPLPLQAAAAAVWRDEEHVSENRRLYQEKYAVADEVFSGVQVYQGPEAGFFLWLPVEDGEAAALKAWKETGVRVLPGAYLAREVNDHNPGRGYIRAAMVAPQTRNAAGANPASRLHLQLRTRENMAYQTRGRDPLLDSNMAQAIEKRGKELIGFALLFCGLAAVA